MTVARRDRDDLTGRTIAVVGGGALLVWLLLRGRGWGSGGPRPATARPAAEPGQPRRCHVRVSGSGIDLDGVRADLPTAIERCRAVGTAELIATGDAIGRVIADVVLALQAAGVDVRADEAVWNTLVGRTSARKPS